MYRPMPPLEQSITEKMYFEFVLFFEGYFVAWTMPQVESNVNAYISPKTEEYIT